MWKSTAAACACWGRDVAQAEAVLVLWSPAGVAVGNKLPPPVGKAWPAKSPESRWCYTSKITTFCCLYCCSQDLMMLLFSRLCSWRRGETTPKSHSCFQNFHYHLHFFQFFSPPYLLWVKLHCYHVFQMFPPSFLRNPTDKRQPWSKSLHLLSTHFVLYSGFSDTFASNSIWLSVPFTDLQLFCLNIQTRITFWVKDSLQEFEL